MGYWHESWGRSMGNVSVTGQWISPTRRAPKIRPTKGVMPKARGRGLAGGSTDIGVGSQNLHSTMSANS